MIDISRIREVTVEATSFCNLHCPQCPRFDQDGFLTRDLRPGHLDPDTFLSNMQFDLMTGLERVRFEGDYGDIMMHPQAQHLLSQSAVFAAVEAITNGSMRSPGWWHELAQIPNLTVTFSIDGLQDTNAVYRINSDWQRIMNNVRAFIGNGGTARWKFLVFRHNQHQVDTARAMSQDLGFCDFEVQHTARSWFQGMSWPVRRDGEFLYDIYPSDLVTTVSASPTVVALQKKREQTPSISCLLPRTANLYVNFLGHVLPCCMTSGQTWRQSLEARMWRRIVGDIDQIDINLRPLSEILAGEFYQARLSRSLQGQDITHPLCIANCA